MIAILSISLGILCILAFGLYATKFNLLSKIYDIRLTEKGIEFFIFSSLPFYTLKYENIKEVIIGYGGFRFMTACDFRNRFFGERCLMIVKKKGVFARNVLISPENASAFIQNIEHLCIPIKNSSH